MSSHIEPPRGVDHAIASSTPRVLRSEDLQGLAASLSNSTRVSVRLRHDGLFEVSTAAGVIGFVEYVGPVFVAPVFVALSGAQPARAVEVAQRLTLAEAVEQLRRADAL